jgi:hypothetical protein
VHAIKRGVESFEKRKKDVKRGKNKEKSMCMEKKARKNILRTRSVPVVDG